MESLHQLEIIILLLAVVLALTTIAQKICIPYPIFLVLGGLLLGLVPGLPTVTLHPDLVFLVFLPPILWAAAYFTSLRGVPAEPQADFPSGRRAGTGDDRRSRGGGACPVTRYGLGGSHCAGGHRLATGCRVGHRCRKTLRIPRRVVTILEGESLVNDATALVLSGLPLARW